MRVSIRSLINLSFISLPYISAFKRSSWISSMTYKLEDIQYIPSLSSTSRGLKSFSKTSTNDSTFFPDRCISNGRIQSVHSHYHLFLTVLSPESWQEIYFVDPLFLPITDKLLDYCWYLKYLHPCHHLLIWHVS